MRPPSALFFFYLILNSYFLILSGNVRAADTTPPTTQATINPSTPDGTNGWYKTPVEVKLSASDDESGVAAINWRLDGGIWQSQNFSGSLNLAPNPSFEQGSGSPISNWNFAGQPASTGSWDEAYFVSGLKSVKIISAQTGWSGFANQTSYVPVQPFDNLTASVWVKTQAVSGLGAYYRIFALTSSGPLELTSSAKITGTNNFLRISKNFVVSSNTAYGVYLDLGVDGPGTVWYDLVEVKNTITDTEVSQTFASPGSHVAQYYSKDNANNQETNKSLSFKIDATAPANWREFSTERVGNEHTLTAAIKVDDSPSQPDPNQGSFQYSVDGGQTYGYYSNLTQCNSNWQSNGWQSLTVNTSNQGVTGTLVTPAVDYCNANWQICKIVRFKIKDLAGNESSKGVCINGAWVKATGDVGSNYSISMDAAGSEANTDGLVVSKNGISNFSSSNNWAMPNYGPVLLDSYAIWFSKYPTSTPLPSGKLPTVSGRYLVNSSFTISNSTLPSNFETATFSAVVFVNGDLTVNSDFTPASGSALLFIVSGNVKVDKNVENMAGFYIVSGDFDTAYNGNNGNQLIFSGGVMANTVSLSRSLNQNPETVPAEQIIFPAKYYYLLSSQLGNTVTTWREILP